MLVIEKAAEVGGHQLSGAVVDPVALEELWPDFLDDGFPLEHRVDRERVYFLGRRFALRLPPPPPMRNHGNLVVSLSRLVQWLARKAEGHGIEIYPGIRRGEAADRGRARGGRAAAGRRGRPRAARPRPPSSRVPRSAHAAPSSGKAPAAPAPGSCRSASACTARVHRPTRPG